MESGLTEPELEINENWQEELAEVDVDWGPDVVPPMGIPLEPPPPTEAPIDWDRDSLGNNFQIVDRAPIPAPARDKYNSWVSKFDTNPWLDLVQVEWESIEVFPGLADLHGTDTDLAIELASNLETIPDALHKEFLVQLTKKTMATRDLIVKNILPTLLSLDPSVNQALIALHQALPDMNMDTALMSRMKEEIRLQLERAAKAHILRHMLTQMGVAAKNQDPFITHSSNDMQNALRQVLEQSKALAKKG